MCFLVIALKCRIGGDPEWLDMVVSEPSNGMCEDRGS